MNPHPNHSDGWARTLVRHPWIDCSSLVRRGLLRFVKPFVRRHQTVRLRAGWTMRLDLQQGHQHKLFWRHEEVEPALQWAIQTLLPVGGTMVDCGANTGIMGFSALHYRHSKTHFFEPLPALAALIRENVRINGHDSRARVWECAASDMDGTAEFFTAIDEKDGCHSLKRSEHTKPDALPLRVKTVRLETVFREAGLTYIDLIKIDTEQHDLAVLNGLGSMLSPQNISMLYVEMATDFETIFSLLKSRGFVPFPSVKQRFKRLRCLDPLPALEPGLFFRKHNQASRRRDYLWCAPGSPCEHYLNSRLPR